jgi:O-antigen ligase
LTASSGSVERRGGEETLDDSSVSIDEWLFLVLVAILPVMWPSGLDLGYVTPLADLLFIVASVAFGVAILKGARRLRWTSWCWLLAVHATALIVATIASEDVRRSTVKLSGALYLTGLAFLTVNYVTSRASLRRAILAWIAGAAVTAAAGVAGILLFYAGFRDSAVNPFLFPFGSLLPGRYPRVMALFLNANMLCTYVVASAMILLGARAAGFISHRLFGIILAGTLVTAAFSLSPGLGGLLLPMSLWWVATRSPGRLVARVAVVAGVVAAVAFVLAATVSPTVLQAKTASDRVMPAFEPSSRLLTWIGAWKTFVGHPWTGRGLGLEAADVHYTNASGFLEVLTDAHNTWLSVLAESGLMGGVAFLALVAPLTVEFQRHWNQGDSIATMRAALQLAFFGGFLYQTLTGAFEDTRHVIHYESGPRWSPVSRCKSPKVSGR